MLYQSIFSKMTGHELTDNQVEFVSRKWTPGEFESYLWTLTLGPDWKYEKTINWILSK